MTFLIAEISNHHMGSMEKAKEMILAAKNCGADAVKSQAFVPKDMLKWGTMPLPFYERCSFSLEEYKELIHFGMYENIPVFFTVLSPALYSLKTVQRYNKLHAGGWEKFPVQKVKTYDHEDSFISMREPRRDIPQVHAAKILYATPYGEDVKQAPYEVLQRFYEKAIGVSHHGCEHGGLLLLHQIYHVPFVEKHFYMGGDIYEDKLLYRDCTHSYAPKKFTELARSMK